MVDIVPAPRPSERCLNCDTIVEQQYCPACGQRRGDFRKSSWRLLGEVFRETLEVDGRVWRTLRAMARPGALTREFNAGRRRQYMSPVRLYLFVSLMLFAVVGLSVRFSTETAAGNTPVQFDLEEQALADWKPDNPLATSVRDRLVELSRMDEERRSQELIRAALEHAPLVMFVLLPIYALLLRLVFVRTRWLYIDHLIFSLHVHTVWFLLLTLGLALVPWLGVNVVLVVAMGLLGYTVAALRHAYEARWGATLARASVLGLLYLLTLGFGIVAAFGLGAALG
ncbi:MAG: DUF3667 domain-containing protein [Deltaproteobacteria bacterium]|nr:DUF3667 domain-containing protein [Deltaproteobacteria bacterium]